MPQDGRLLEGFVSFLEAAGAERISTDLALAWARSPGQAHPSYWGQRLTVVRGFARHLATLDPASEVPAHRVSELTGLRIGDVHLGVGAHIRVTGKGRKMRSIPLTGETAAVLSTSLQALR